MHAQIIHQQCHFFLCSCVDDSGNWGHGRLFDALAKLSASIPSAYEQASEVGDLHLGDLHLIEITGENLTICYSNFVTCLKSLCLLFNF